MSQLLQQNGPLFVSDGTEAPFLVKGGIPYGRLSDVAIDFTSGVDHWHQGLPFTAAGRIAATSDVPTRFNSGAMPLNAAGRLCVDITGAAATSYLAGVPYSGDGKIPATVAAPPTFATLDPNNKSPIMILSENNLRCLSNSAATRGAAFSTNGKSSGKWYWEVLSLSQISAQGVGIGVAGSNINEYLGENAFNWGYFPTGAYWTAAQNQGTGSAYFTNSILGFALDATGNLDVYVGNVLSFSVVHGLTGPIWAGVSDSSTGGVCDFMMNFGSDSSFGGRQTPQGNTDQNGIGDFYFAPPAGYLAIIN